MNRAQVWAMSAVACGGLVLVAVLGLAWSLLHAPVTFENVWGFAPEGRVFAALPGAFGPRTSWPPETFVTAARVALAAAWAAWAALVVRATASLAWLSIRTAFLAVIAASALVVVAFPPALSRDVLGYAAYGRVVGLYGLNPYLHGRQALETLGDPAAVFLVWDTPLPYGPAWVLFSGAVAWIGQATAGLWVEVCLHKAAAGLALIVAAVAGADLAERHRPGTRAMAFLVIGLNPLLLIEGPGTGHNDLMMTCLLVVAAALSARRQHVAAALVAGLAAAVKPVALAALPLLAAELWWVGTRWQVWLRVAALSLLPSFVLSFAFGGPGVFVEAVAQRVRAAPGHTPLALAIALAGAGLLAAMHVRRVATDGIAGGWLVAWIPVALVIALVVMPIHFPWYITWALLPALTRLGSRGLPYLTTSLVVAAFLMWQYTVPV